MHGPADNDKTFFHPLPLHPALCMKLFWGFSIQLLEPLLFSCAFFFFYAFLSLFPNLPITSACQGSDVDTLSADRSLTACAHFTCTVPNAGTCRWVSYLELAKERSPFCLSSNELWIRWTERRESDRRIHAPNLWNELPRDLQQSIFFDWYFFQHENKSIWKK